MTQAAIFKESQRLKNWPSDTGRLHEPLMTNLKTAPTMQAVSPQAFHDRLKTASTMQAVSPQAFHDRLKTAPTMQAATP